MGLGGHFCRHLSRYICTAFVWALPVRYRLSHKGAPACIQADATAIIMDVEKFSDPLGQSSQPDSNYAVQVADHTDNALWLGTPLPLNIAICKEGGRPVCSALQQGHLRLLSSGRLLLT